MTDPQLEMESALYSDYTSEEEWAEKASEAPSRAARTATLHSSSFPAASSQTSHISQVGPPLAATRPRVTTPGRLYSSNRPGAMITSFDHDSSSYPTQGNDYSNPAPASASPPPNATPIHKRGYQACENCRKRKTKCVPRGDVDNPGPPPCKRCARERMECEFAPTRKKRKTGELDDNAGPSNRPGLNSMGRDNESNDYSISPAQMDSQAGHFGSDDFSHWAPSSHSHVSHQLGVLGSDGDRTNGGSHLRSDLAKESLRSAVATTQDNLQMLVHAAVQTSAGADKAADLKSPSIFGSPLSVQSSRTRTFSSNAMTPGHGSLTGLAQETSNASDPALDGAIRAWERMRFVRAGWFTAMEAMRYVEYFYSNMAPMTPIVTPEYRHPSKHETLLNDEPVLAIAILAIASRHMQLEGLASVSRSYEVHAKLWNYLRQMVERLLWAQEQFGGGFCGAGSSAHVKESTSGQLTWKGSLRTLGTIEAILLLTDWQPRALHFPPGDDENRLLEGTSVEPPQLDGTASNGHNTLPFASWLEPAWRSDRMAWMLLGLAQALSFELGVFDQKHYDCQHDHDPSSDCARKRRVRRLVLVYVSQNSGRLGIPSMLPLDMWEVDEVFERTNQLQRNGQPEDPIDIMQGCWLGIASVMYEANRQIFPSRQFTRDLISTGQYKGAIDKFRPKLEKWKVCFDKLAPKIQPLMRYILTMEYEYARTYINSLGLQKVVESWVGKPNAEHASADYLQATYRPNHKYIEDVTDASRNILRAILEGLALGGHIKNAPTRIFTRGLSGMLFTLKVTCLIIYGRLSVRTNCVQRFSVGAYEQEVRKSLEMLDRTTDVLLKNAVDDVHLVNQTSRMVEVILSNIKKTFIRVQPPANGSEAASRDGSRHPTPHQQPDPGQTQVNGSTQRRPRAVSSNTRQIGVATDPLAGIRGQPIDEISNMIMPPPNYNFQTSGFDQNIPVDPSIDLPGWNADWLTLPLDKFMEGQAANMTVDQGFGGIGPTVGDRDMLEILTNQQYNQWNGAGGNYFGAYP